MLYICIHFCLFCKLQIHQIHMLVFFPSDDKNHSDKHCACVSLSSCLKFSEAVGTASERQTTLLQLSGQGSWLRCGSQRAVAMLCPKHLWDTQLNAACAPLDGHCCSGSCQTPAPRSPNTDIRLHLKDLLVSLLKWSTA